MIEVGSAYTTITNRIGTTIQGATVGGVAKYIRDELEANALYVKGSKTGVMFVSCDLGGLEAEVTIAAREAMAAATGLDPRSIIIGATHTGGPSVIPSNYLKPVDSEYLEALQAKLAELATRTMDSVRPARMGFGMGSARIGYNRRCCWKDGTHSMGRGKHMDDEFTGLEGPVDADQLALYAVDQDGEILGIIHHNTSHPCTFYGADFYSADYPGLARRYIRDALGEVPVLFFNGALGDIGQDRMDQPVFSDGKSDKDLKLARAALPLAGETLRLIYENPPRDDLDVKHLQLDLDVPTRLPSEERLRWAAEILRRVDAGEKNIPPFEIVFAHGATLLQKRFGADPTDTLPIHAIKIGNAAIVTQPTELFCQFGLDIKSRSPFPLTAVFGITDGYHGYCPTYQAIAGGGYSAETIYWTRLSPDAGYKIVDQACNLLNQL